MDDEKRVSILLVFTISLVSGCATKNNTSTKQSVSVDMPQEQDDSIYTYKLSDFQEINKEELISSDTSQFYDLECNPINPSELTLKRYVNYLIDD